MIFLPVTDFFLLAYIYFVLVSAVQQSESTAHMYIFPHAWIFFPFRSPEGTE